MPDFNAEAAEDSVVLSGATHRDGSSARSTRGPYLVYSFLPACAGNDPNRADSLDGGCPAAEQMCATTAPGLVMFWRYSAVRAQDGSTSPWLPAGSVCLRRDAVPGGAVPAFTAADLRRLPLPAPPVLVQPADRRTLVQVPTNLFSTDRPATFRLRLLATPVLVRATPVAWAWTYGDGQATTFDRPGGPYPQLGTAHTYTQPGRHRITLTTTWTGTYTVNGSPPIPIDGTATVTSPPITITAVETRAQLVDDLRS